jgi:hypothetical protein
MIDAEKKIKRQPPRKRSFLLAPRAVDYLAISRIGLRRGSLGCISAQIVHKLSTPPTRFQNPAEKNSRRFSLHRR